MSETTATANALKKWGPLGVIVGLMAAGYAFGLHKYLTLSSLIMNREVLLNYLSENFFLASIAFIAIYIVAVALSFPGASLLTIAGGFLFGWAVGGALAAVAATIGAAVIFLAASTSFGAVLQEKAGPSLAKLADGFKENAFSYLLFLRLVPLFPFWLINLAPAMFKVTLPTYVSATFLGILPGTFAYSYLGEGLDSIIAAQEKANPGCAEAGTCTIDLKAALTPEIIGAMVALVVVSLIPIALNAWKKQKKTAS